jgi:hypothetical protein
MDVVGKLAGDWNFVRSYLEGLDVSENRGFARSVAEAVLSSRPSPNTRPNVRRPLLIPSERAIFPALVMAVDLSDEVESP